MTEFVYLHGFASGPSSQKASAFKKKFKEIGISIYIPDLEGGNFENMTLSSQLNIIFNLLNQLNSKEVCLIGSSMGGYLASLVAELRDEVKAAYLIAPGFNLSDTSEFNLFKNFLNLAFGVSDILKLYPSDFIIDKFFIAAILALFGNDPENAIDAAIAMQHRLKEYNSKNIIR